MAVRVREAPPYVHTFSHRIWEVTPALYRVLPSAEMRVREGKWRVFSLWEIRSIGFPRAFARGLEALLGYGSRV